MRYIKVSNEQFADKLDRFGRKEAKILERLCCWIFDHTEEDMLFKK